MFGHIVGLQEAYLVFCSTERTMIFCRRSYMRPEATVKMWTHSGSSSAVKFAPASLRAAALMPSQDDIFPHTESARCQETQHHTACFTPHATDGVKLNSQISVQGCNSVALQQ